MIFLFHNFRFAQFHIFKIESLNYNTQMLLYFILLRNKLNRIKVLVVHLIKLAYCCQTACLILTITLIFLEFCIFLGVAINQLIYEDPNHCVLDILIASYLSNHEQSYPLQVFRIRVCFQIFVIKIHNIKCKYYKTQFHAIHLLHHYI